VSTRPPPQAAAGRLRYLPTNRSAFLRWNVRSSGGDRQSEEQRLVDETGDREQARSGEQARRRISPRRQEKCGRDGGGPHGRPGRLPDRNSYRQLDPATRHKEKHKRCRWVAPFRMRLAEAAPPRHSTAASHERPQAVRRRSQVGDVERREEQADGAVHEDHGVARAHLARNQIEVVVVTAQRPRVERAAHLAPFPNRITFTVSNTIVRSKTTERCLT
jgi:hypothetical protein